MFPVLNIGDTFTGEHKYCFTTTTANPLSFECFPDVLTFVVKDANFALENNKRYQNILFQGFISSIPPFVAVGVYDRCNGQGDLYEEPIDNVEVFPGLNVIQMSKDGQTLTVKYTEIYNASAASYVAELKKT